MIKIRAGDLSDSMDVVCSILDDVTMKFANGELSVDESDLPCICYVRFKLRSSAFVEYDSGKFESIRVSSKDFMKCLKRFASDSIVMFEFSDNKLTLTDGSKSFDIDILAVSDEDKGVDASELYKRLELLPVKFTLSYSGLTDIIDDIKSTVKEKSSPSVSFSKKSNILKISANNYRKKIVLNDDKEADSSYGLNFLDNALKRRISDTVDISYGADAPIFIRHNGKNSSLDVVVMCRISSD